MKNIKPKDPLIHCNPWSKLDNQITENKRGEENDVKEKTVAEY